jgi:hypothetical protein
LIKVNTRKYKSNSYYYLQHGLGDADIGCSDTNNGVE